VGAAGVDEVEERCEGSIGVPAVGVVPVDDAELLAAGQGRVVEVAVEVVEPEDRPPVVLLSRDARRDLPDPLGPASTTTRWRDGEPEDPEAGAVVGSWATDDQSRTNPRSELSRPVLLVSG
jgi:hypothetical protein